ncbi:MULTISPECIES: secretion protein HylD [Rhizobium/Agrobacterium group]|uniref:secretion protein HylD n=1 Tax=Rhizobium/Agrobacterium group TaxID=227290 RepID=UPI000B4028B7|nr:MULTISPECIES: secretion protein HylD [Rhizobium/Agrobacterium group]MCF1481648.1 secretion protein HylD [Allorhizobium ampelinum]NSZ42581.1 secretion protein HylD [Agrobacterium vitis]NTA26289.1 secretion protein HylD [Allorhizobium ampelinum]OVE95591.1 secretion protein HylD [Allorhizobium ampelinum]
MIAIALTAWSALKALRGKLDWRGIALIAAVLIAGLGLHRWASSLKEAGRTEIRQQWAEAQRKADLLQLAKIEAQQKQINAADAALVATMAAHVGQVAGLEAALAEEREKDNAKPNAAAGAGAAPACSAMPDGVRNALNAIGATDR